MSASVNPNAHAAVERIANALSQSGFRAEQHEIGGREALVARRAESAAMLSRIHTFVVVFALDSLDAQQVEQLSADAQQYAIRHKGGLPRGLQTGTVTIPVFVTNTASAEAVGWLQDWQGSRYAAMRLPVLADPATGELTYFTGRWKRGWLYADQTTGLVRDVVGPALTSPPAV